MPNPKGRMMSLFKENGKTYIDVQYARRLAGALADLNQLLKCPTFRRFAEKVIGRGM